MSCDIGGGGGAILASDLDSQGAGQGLANPRVSCGLLCRSYGAASYALFGCCRSAKNLGFKLPPSVVRGSGHVVRHEDGGTEIEADRLGVSSGAGAASRLDSQASVGRIQARRRQGVRNEILFGDNGSS